MQTLEYIKVLWSNVPFISVQTILSSFSEAIVIVLQSTLNEIQKTLVDIHGVKMKLHFEGIPDNDLGTADSLKLLKGKVKVRNFTLSMYSIELGNFILIKIHDVF
jgi:hypothetical protein